MRALTLAALLAVAGCDGFDEVRKQDSIEAYERYLTENPQGRSAVEAKTRLEALMIERARTDKTLAAYDAYLKRFPKGVYARDAFNEREAFLWDWADLENTAQAWDTYLREYPSFEANKVKKARKRKAAAEYRGSLSWTEPTFEQANLAEDPTGPLNGWKFTAQVTNNGDKTLTSLHMTVRYLDGSGVRLSDETWPAASPNFGVPVEEWRKAPLKPGETRQWELLSDSVPSAWSKKFEFFPSSVTFEKLKAGGDD
jgi:hypothetical protein